MTTACTFPNVHYTRIDFRTDSNIVFKTQGKVRRLRPRILATELEACQEELHKLEFDAQGEKAR
eukprot:3418922-Amphidinium_carterae.1